MDVYGTPQAETLNGTPGNDEMGGMGADDVVNGQAGDDVVYWRTGTKAGTSDGNDVVDGGPGSDRFAVIASSAQVSEYPYEYTHSYRLSVVQGVLSWSMETTGHGRVVGTDIVTQVRTGMTGIEAFSFYGNYGPSAQPDDSIDVGNLSGTDMTGLLFFDLGPGKDDLYGIDATNRIAANGGDGDDYLSGGSADDELVGGTGNDTLWGNGGTNTLLGGTGDDRYYSNNRFDSVIENAGEGIDKITTTASYYVLHANVENLTGGGAAGFTGLGNASDNTIEGGVGNDYLIGLEGNDILWGQGGLNTLQGGTGDDTYHPETTGDTLYELAGEGTDTIFTDQTTYTIPANFENLQESYALPGVTWTGNALDNLIIGSALPDTLVGLEGNDILEAGRGTADIGNTLRGGVGNDTYRIHNDTDHLIELAGEGTDTVVFSTVEHVNYTLQDEFENLELSTNFTGSDAFRLTGNAADNRITGNVSHDNLAGGNGNDTLLGGANGDSLSGQAGNDVLNGGTGADELSGGSGADRFVFDNLQQQDLVHDFTRADGDKVDVSELLAGIGYSGTDPLADGHLLLQEIASFGSGGVPATRLLFDTDAGGAAAPISLAVFLGADHTLVAADFIIA
jgi:Ca2+-binding RTX toxin-like protein